MSTHWVAAFPMYDFPQLRESTDTFWAAVAGRLRAAGVADVPGGLTRSVSHREVWGHPKLLLSQACEYPLMKSFAGRVRLVATPCYSAPGCEGRYYRSALVVRRSDTSTSLGELRGRRCAVNEVDSNSGMNLLRAAVAPLAATDKGRPFFASVELSGSHLRSAQMVAAGVADVAAIDCVSFEHFRRLEPAVVDKLRVLGWTEASPALPFITAGSVTAGILHALRRAVAEVFADNALAAVREQLLLRGVDVSPAEDFAQVRQLERAAIELGYRAIDGLPS